MANVARAPLDASLFRALAPLPLSYAASAPSSRNETETAHVHAKLDRCFRRRCAACVRLAVDEPAQIAERDRAAGVIADSCSACNARSVGHEGSRSIGRSIDGRCGIDGSGAINPAFSGDSREHQAGYQRAGAEDDARRFRDDRYHVRSPRHCGDSWLREEDRCRPRKRRDTIVHRQHCRTISRRSAWPRRPPCRRDSARSATALRSVTREAWLRKDAGASIRL